MDRDDARDEVTRALARIGAATDGLTPDPRLTDAVLAAAQDARPAEDPLAAIARKTSSLDAGGALSEAVMARVGRAAPATPPSWLDGVVRTGPVAVGLAALAAAASFVLFLASQSDVEATIASSVDTVEVSE